VPLIELDADIVIPGYGRAQTYLAQVAEQRIEKVETCQCPLQSAAKAKDAGARLAASHSKPA
jgi:2-amino-4-hydroxy-6-hydroxymethyldihydropteridine diphosphokinase